MGKKTITVLGILIFIISLGICYGIIRLNNQYTFDEYLARICGEEDKETKCVYVYLEYNPLTYKHTFYYQVTSKIDNKEISTIDNGSMKSIESILDIAASHNADQWIEVGEESFASKDNEYVVYRKGVRITREDLISIVDELTLEDK